MKNQDYINAIQNMSKISVKKSISVWNYLFASLSAPDTDVGNKRNDGPLSGDALKLFTWHPVLQQLSINKSHLYTIRARASTLEKLF